MFPKAVIPASVFYWSIITWVLNVERCVYAGWWFFILQLKVYHRHYLVWQFVCITWNKFATWIYFTSFFRC